MITANDIIWFSKILGSIGVIFGALSSVYIFFKKFFTTVSKTETIYKSYEKFTEHMAGIQQSMNDVKQDIKTINNNIMNQTTEVENLKKQIETNNELTLNIAREKLLKILREVIDNNAWNSGEQFGVVSKMYEAYVKNGGNSEIVKLMQKAEKLPVHRELEEKEHNSEDK